MAELKGMEAGKRRAADEPTSLDSLNRTLEQLEARLSRLTASHARAAADLQDHQGVRPPEAEKRVDVERRVAASAGGRSSARADLSQAVSEIVIRQRALNRAQASQAEPRASHGNAHSRLDTQPQEMAVETFAPMPVADAGTLARGAARTSAPAGLTITQQLERLREELRADMAKSFQPRFDDMRDAVDDLRKMISERASGDRIEAEIARVNEGLARMSTSGADQAGVAGLRSELESIRSLVQDVAREESLKDADRKWDDIRATINNQEVTNTSERRDIKDELERLRLSLGSLASEEHIKAVERRWDEFESRYPVRQEGPDISELLKSEMTKLREKLETLASEQSIKAVEERWGLLEDRFASRAVEQNIDVLATRMEQLEKTLSKLPENLALEPIEARLKALGEGLEALGQSRANDADDAHFQALDERLDEISRAIVAAATKAPPVDMSPVERVEARLQSLSNRVDSLGEADVDGMSARIAELADRIEGLSNGPAIALLTERIESFSGKLETLADLPPAGPSLDVSALEQRLEALAARMELIAAPSLDPEIIAALEAQISRLSDRIAEVGSLSALSDPELDERLATIEFRIEENREAILESAEAAAEAAVRRMMENGVGGQNAYVEQLAGDLRALQEMSRASGEQSQSFYETMHATLMKLVDRIDRIDSDLSSRPEHAVTDGEAHDGAGDASASRGFLGLLKRRNTKTADVPLARDESGDHWQEPKFSDDAASVDQGYPVPLEGRRQVPDTRSEEFGIADTEANRPLAVGSGQPDIVSLIERVRAQQAGRAQEDHGGKSDYIAAARRAALAAAAEADSMRASADQAEDEGARTGFASRIQRRRKPILLAVSAVLLALLALPLSQVASNMLSDPEPAREAVIDQSGIQNPAPLALDRQDAGTGTAAMDGSSPATRDRADDGVAPSGALEGSVPEGAGASQFAPMDSAPKIGFSLSDGAGESSRAPVAGSATAADDVATANNSAEPVSADAATPAAKSAMAQPQAVASSDLPMIPEGLASEPLIQAAQDGDPKALFEIGLRLMEGRVGEPDPKNAAPWFQLSADRGFAPAEYSLGTLYEKGNGVDRDLVRARDAYLAAADNGNVRAMHNLAVLYATGIDGKSEPIEAAKWFEMAASYGMPDSQYNLGILYARGAGVDQDLVKSYKWFSIVAGAGDSDASSKRDEIKKALTPTQLAGADSDIAAFKPQVRTESANTVDIPKEWSGPSEKTETSSIDMTRAIRNIQAILTKLGYDPGVADGVIGDKTTDAIKAFQKDTGLQANGRIDETLIRKLLERKDG